MSSIKINGNFILGVALGVALSYLALLVVLYSFSLPEPVCPEANVSLSCPEPIFNLSCPSYEVPIIQPNISTYNYGCYSDFENIAYAMARQKEYVLDVYDCTEFSQALARRYNELGWNAMTKVVRVDCDNGWFGDECNGVHEVVRIKDVYVEALTGEIIHPDDYVAYGLI